VEEAAGKQVVLFVEDEAFVRMNAVDMVEEAGFEVIEAANADEAILVLEARRNMTIVFTDIDMLGSMNGVKVAEAVRGRWPPIKIDHRNVGTLRPSRRRTSAGRPVPSEALHSAASRETPQRRHRLRSTISLEKVHRADSRRPSMWPTTFLGPTLTNFLARSTWLIDLRRQAEFLGCKPESQSTTALTQPIRCADLRPSDKSLERRWLPRQQRTCCRC
jgi:CheY-like chemotaxis protein